MIQDSSRALSIGKISDTATAQTEILGKIADIAPHATVKTQVLDGVIVTAVQVPLSDLGTLGIIQAFDPVTMKFSAQLLSEGRDIRGLLRSSAKRFAGDINGSGNMMWVTFLLISMYVGLWASIIQTVL